MCAWSSPRNRVGFARCAKRIYGRLRGFIWGDAETRPTCALAAGFFWGAKATGLVMIEKRGWWHGYPDWHGMARLVTGSRQGGTVARWHGDSDPGEHCRGVRPAC